MIDLEEIEAAVEADPVGSACSTLAFSSRDWSAVLDVAWVWGILQGWSPEAMRELQKSFGWSDEDVTRLAALHRHMATMQSGLAALAEWVRDAAKRLDMKHSKEAHEEAASIDEYPDYSARVPGCDSCELLERLKL